jgi:hypothetical protein
MVQELANVLVIRHETVDAEARLDRILTKRVLAAIKVSASRSCRPKKERSTRPIAWKVVPNSIPMLQSVPNIDSIKEKVVDLLADLFPGEPLHPWTGDLEQARSWRIPRWSEGYEPSACWLNFRRKRP